MKGYILLFITIMFGIVLSGVAVGTASTGKALNLRAAGGLEPLLGESRDAIRNAYRLSEEAGVPARIRDSLENAALAVDRSIAAAVRFEVFKAGIFRSLLANIILVAFTAVLAGIVLWYGTFILFLKPLRKTAEEIGRAPDFSAIRTIPRSGCREMRLLQTSLNGMFSRIRVLESAIRESERENIGRFLVHQLKNSLTPMKLCARNLKSLCTGDRAAGENIALILDEANRVDALLDRFRMFYKFPEPVRSEVELNAFLLAVGRRYDGLETIPAEEELRVSADRNLLEEAVMNLVDNALEACPGGPVILRSGRSPVPFLEVEDRGCGMTDEQTVRMFDEYFTTKPQGMGLGLPFVKKVLDRHGFGISVESIPNKGTRIRVEFNEKDPDSRD